MVHGTGRSAGGCVVNEPPKVASILLMIDSQNIPTVSGSPLFSFGNQSILTQEDTSFSTVYMRYGPGDTFGEVALFYPARWESRIRVRRVCTLLHMNISTFGQILDSCPEVCSTLVREGAKEQMQLLLAAKTKARAQARKMGRNLAKTPHSNTRRFSFMKKDFMSEMGLNDPDQLQSPQVRQTRSVGDDDSPRALGARSNLNTNAPNNATLQKVLEAIHDLRKEMLRGGAECRQCASKLRVPTASSSSSSSLPSSPIRAKTQPPLSEDQGKKLLRTIFDEADVDKSGEINREEFATLSEQMGHKMTKEELDETMKLIDTSGDGSLSFEEFYQWFTSMQQSRRHCSSVVPAVPAGAGAQPAALTPQLVPPLPGAGAAREALDEAAGRQRGVRPRSSIDVQLRRGSATASERAADVPSGITSNGKAAEQLQPTEV